MCIKGKSCNSPEGLQIYLKTTPTQVFSCEYPKSLRYSFSYRTTPVAAFALSFSIRKEFKKKKVSEEVAFALINLFHVQI